MTAKGHIISSPVKLKIDMILVLKELQSSIREAFKENSAHENFIQVKASDQNISINYQPLAIFSPYFRSLISSAPCGKEPTLFLPEFSASSVALFMSLITHGTTDDSIKSPGEAADVIKVAKAFDIDASDYSVVVQEDKFLRARKVSNSPKVVSAVPEVTTVEEIIKKESGVEIMELAESYNSEEVLTEGHNNDITPDNILDESLMTNVSLLSQADESIVSKDGESTGMRCQICSVPHTKLSVLHIHYIHAHFMQEARSEFRSFATEKFCNLCGKECKTSQQLFVHIGVKHKKVNMLLARHGYKEHIKPTRNNIREAELLQTEETPCIDDLAINSTAVDVGKNDTATAEVSESSEKKLNACQVCDKSIEGLSFLWQHYTTSHFTKDIKQSYGSLMDFEQLRCKLCDKKMKQRQGLLTHMGAVHHKVNEVLVKYGLNPLEIRNSKHEKSTLDSYA